MFQGRKFFIPEITEDHYLERDVEETMPVMAFLPESSLRSQLNPSFEVHKRLRQLKPK